MDITSLHELFLKSGQITTDSRAITKGSIFFALKGERFNGNTYAAEALQKGAAYTVIDDANYTIDARTILVNDVLETLQQLAAYHRKTFNFPVLGLTGSNGKTTTKELIHAVLSRSFKAVATRGNLNNHIGVPLTLLSMDAATEFGIVEMGANHQGEIAALCAIASPGFGCITNFGKAHLEGFGGLQGVIKGKSELYQHLMQHHNTVFYNADDGIQRKKLNDYDKTYGFSQQKNNSDLHIQLIDAHPFVHVAVEGISMASQLTGAYNFDNIALAITVGRYFNVPLPSIKAAIEAYVPENNRSQIVKKNDHTIILDAYNANPTSMKAALDNFETFPGDRKIACLGDMFELGEQAAEEHQDIADYASKKGLEAVYLIGTRFHDTQTSCKTFETFEAFTTFLQHHPLQYNTILIKGSRGMALERLLEFL